MARGRPDKRRSTRQKTDSVLELYDMDGSLIVGVGRLMDFSATGACFSTSKRLTVGDPVRASLRLPGEKEVSVQARVVWVRAGQRGAMVYGVEFKKELGL